MSAVWTVQIDLEAEPWLRAVAEEALHAKLPEGWEEREVPAAIGRALQCIALCDALLGHTNDQNDLCITAVPMMTLLAMTSAPPFCQVPGEDGEPESQYVNTQYGLKQADQCDYKRPYLARYYIIILFRSCVLVVSLVSCTDRDAEARCDRSPLDGYFQGQLAAARQVHTAVGEAKAQEEEEARERTEAEAAALEAAAVAAAEVAQAAAEAEARASAEAAAAAAVAAKAEAEATAVAEVRARWRAYLL